METIVLEQQFYKYLHLEGEEMRLEGAMLMVNYCKCMSSLSLIYIDHTVSEFRYLCDLFS